MGQCVQVIVVSGQGSEGGLLDIVGTYVKIR